jgi:hypothetical protein
MAVDVQISQGPVEVAPGGCWPAVEQRRILLEALAGVELGEWDGRIVDWLAGWDACTVLTIASWIVRSRAAEPQR